MPAAFSNPLVLETAFWLSFALLFHTFVGYPLLMRALAGTRPQPAPGTPTATPPHVTVVIAARNEGERIVPRLENLLTSDYPADRLSVILVSDGSTDQSAARAAELDRNRIRLIDRQERAGKPACLNLGVASACPGIVVFADARQRFAPDAIAKLARHFADPAVGAVSGALHIESASSSIGGGVDAYWKLERFIRAAEARWDSCIGCTGAIYAIRRELYEAIPDDTLIDDVEIPMRIAIKGSRVLYDFDARAYDSQSLEPARETIRKKRTIAGNYQMLFRHPGWLFPWNNRLLLQLISHKYLRLAAPFLLAILLASNITLARQPPYGILLVFHGAFYALALLGAALPSLRLAPLSLPAGFVFLNLMSFRGFLHYLFNDPEAGWKSAAESSRVEG